MDKTLQAVTIVADVLDKSGRVIYSLDNHKLDVDEGESGEESMRRAAKIVLTEFTSAWEDKDEQIPAEVDPFDAARVRVRIPEMRQREQFTFQIKEGMLVYEGWESLNSSPLSPFALGIAPLAYSESEAIYNMNEAPVIIWVGEEERTGRTHGRRSTASAARGQSAGVGEGCAGRAAAD